MFDVFKISYQNENGTKYKKMKLEGNRRWKSMTSVKNKFKFIQTEIQTITETITYDF